MPQTVRDDEDNRSTCIFCVLQLLYCLENTLLYCVAKTKNRQVPPRRQRSTPNYNHKLLISEKEVSSATVTDPHTATASGQVKRVVTPLFVRLNEGTGADTEKNKTKASWLKGKAINGMVAKS